MSTKKPFFFQFIIVGGFLLFLYVFFALATSVYRDYKLDTDIQQFERSIEELARLAGQKPKDVAYFQSLQYKDRYAKENLNLLNAGERAIIIPREEQNVKQEEITLKKPYFEQVLQMSSRHQWWEYFFGNTLSLNATDPLSPADRQTDQQKPVENSPAEG